MTEHANLDENICKFWGKICTFYILVSSVKLEAKSFHKNKKTMLFIAML